MIKIHKTPHADTRHCEGIPTKQQLYKDSVTHIQDVHEVLAEIGKQLQSRAHDVTKLSNIDSFYADFVDTIQNHTDFTQGEWYQDHITSERHHLESHVPEDVNLLDVIEYIADVTCAGKARSGKAGDIKLNPDVVVKSFYNTVKLINDLTE